MPFFLISTGGVIIWTILKQMQMFETEMTAVHPHMLCGNLQDRVHRNKNILCSHLTALLHEITSDLYLNQVLGLSIGAVKENVKER